jgi:hypothetical protein
MLVAVVVDMLVDEYVVVVHQPQALSHMPAMSLSQPEQNSTSHTLGSQMLFSAAQAMLQKLLPAKL